MSNQEVEYEVKKLNLLAFPRDVFPICEMTGGHATVQLVTQFGQLYYASEEYAEQAWFGIIKKIAHLLPPLMIPVPVVGTQEERFRRANNLIASKRLLVDFCLSETSNLLSVQKYQLAVPAALQALKFCRQIDGTKNMSSVEPFLQLAQAFLGLRELKKAEEYLAQARWIVLNVDNCNDKTRSKLHLLMGRVSATQGDFNGAKVEFAKGIFFASKCYGAEAIATSMGYFRLGEVFLAQDQLEIALDFFDKVVDIWYKYLTGLYTSSEVKRQAALAKISASQNRLVVPIEIDEDIIESLSDEQLSDGRNQLEQILDNRRKLLGSSHITIGEAQCTLGLFDFFLIKMEKSAETHIINALKAYEANYGADHASTKHVQSILSLVQKEISINKESSR